MKRSSRTKIFDNCRYYNYNAEITLLQACAPTRDVLCAEGKRLSNNCVCRPIQAKFNDPQVVDLKSQDIDESDISAYLYIYAYVLKSLKLKSGQKREKMTVTLRFRSFDRYEDNMKEAQKWKAQLKALMGNRKAALSKIRSWEEGDDRANGNLLTMSPCDETGNKILVVLNPKSGVGKARDIFQQRVVPILTDAEIDYDVHVTSCPNDASFLRPNNSPNLSPSPRTSQTPNTDKEEKRPTSLDISQSS
ncbi:hypothetical protein M8J76_003094 [Diaphorina citri]|nr:hypothetical protein M8J76_003094 [Diaphorina citri]